MPYGPDHSGKVHIKAAVDTGIGQVPDHAEITHSHAPAGQGFLLGHDKDHQGQHNNGSAVIESLDVYGVVKHFYHQHHGIDIYPGPLGESMVYMQNQTAYGGYGAHRNCPVFPPQKYVEGNEHHRKNGGGQNQRHMRNCPYLVDSPDILHPSYPCLSCLRREAFQDLIYS